MGPRRPGQPVDFTHGNDRRRSPDRHPRRDPDARGVRRREGGDGQEPDPGSLALWLEVRGIQEGSFVYDLYFQAVADRARAMPVTSTTSSW